MAAARMSRHKAKVQHNRLKCVSRKIHFNLARGMRRKMARLSFDSHRAHSLVALEDLAIFRRLRNLSADARSSGRDSKGEEKL